MVSQSIVLDSEYELALKEVLEGKEIDFEEEELLKRLTERLDEYPTRIVKNIEPSLKAAHFSLEQYTGASLQEVRVLLEKPWEYDSWDIRLEYDGTERVMNARKRLCFDINQHFLTTQREVLSILPLLRIARLTLEYYRKKNQETQKKLEELQKSPIETTENKKKEEVEKNENEKKEFEQEEFEENEEEEEEFEEFVEPEKEPPITPKKIKPEKIFEKEKNKPSIITTKDQGSDSGKFEWLEKERKKITKNRGRERQRTTADNRDSETVKNEKEEETVEEDAFEKALKSTEKE